VSHMTEICYRGRCVMTKPKMEDVRRRWRKSNATATTTMRFSRELILHCWHFSVRVYPIKGMNDERNEPLDIFILFCYG
jgi:hypothetical protein